MTQTDDELKPEAGGGGNRIRPPITVITGDDPEREPYYLHRHFETLHSKFAALRRQLEALQRACEHREAVKRMEELKALRKPS